MDKQDIIDGLDVILGRRGEKITQGDLLIVEAAIMALARSPRPDAPKPSVLGIESAKRDAADAARYRWLRDAAHDVADSPVMLDLDGAHFREDPDAASIDQAIDKTMGYKPS